MCCDQTKGITINKQCHDDANAIIEIVYRYYCCIDALRKYSFSFAELF